jgi:thiamine biosynthesis lipoprotein
MMADALATALTVMGTQAALAYAEQRKIAVRLVEQTDDGYQEFFSSEFRAMLE